MLLTIDVGNSNIGFGLFQGSNLIHRFRCDSNRTNTSDQYAVFVRHALALRPKDSFGTDAPIGHIDAAIVASTVPSLTDAMVAMVRCANGCEPVVVGACTQTGMPILCENPHEVGADRIVNAIAAYENVQGGVIVVDFGTATTFDCVSPRGEFLGGAIVPGLRISADALFSRAAKLAHVELTVPPRVVGRNTTHAIQSGIMFGYASLVEGMIQKMRDELGFPCAIWATGGLAPVIVQLVSAIERVDQNLTYDGMRIVYERNKVP